MGEGGSDIALTLAEYVVGLRLWWWVVAGYFLVTAQMIPRWSAFFYVMAFSMALGALTYIYPVNTFKLLFTIMSLLMPIYLVVHLRERWAHIQERKNAPPPVPMNLFGGGSDDALHGEFFHHCKAAIISDADGNIVEANPRLAAAFGYRPDELEGQPLVMLMPEEERKDHLRQYDEFINTAKATDTTLIESRVVGEHKDGRTMTMFLTRFRIPVFDGTDKTVYGGAVARDIR